VTPLILQHRNPLVVFMSYVLVAVAAVQMVKVVEVVDPLWDI
jgi:hypothetical protein